MGNVLRVQQRRHSNRNIVDKNKECFIMPELKYFQLKRSRLPCLSISSPSVTPIDIALGRPVKPSDLHLRPKSRQANVPKISTYNSQYDDIDDDGDFKLLRWSQLTSFTDVPSLSNSI